MKNRTVNGVRLVYGILVTLSLIAAAICLMAGAITVYRSGGEQIYTAQKVADAFAPIAPVVYLALALSLGGFILHFLLPAENKMAKPEKNHAAILHRLLEKRDVTTGDAAVVQGIWKAENVRRLHWSIAIALLVIGSAVFLIFGADPKQFGMTGINESMARAMYIMLPCLAVPFGYAVFAAYYNKVSLQKQIDLVKQLPLAETPAAPPAASTQSAVTVTRWVIFGLSVCFIVYGFLAGGTADVVTKAVNICTECVGLG